MFSNSKAVIAALLFLCGIAQAQIISDEGIFGVASAPATYVGPGNIIAGATPWGSCARVYTTALASTTTSLCDLIASGAPNAAVCTLRGTASGTVDLSAYCPGSLTPSAACAAATGGSCLISKVYDQAGTNHYTNAGTVAISPPIVFSALNGLPGISCGNGTPNTQVQSVNTVTQAQPNSMSIVVERTNASNTGGVYGALTTNTHGTLSGTASANQLVMNAGAPINIAATDNAFHRINFVFSGASGAYEIDGTDNISQNAGTTGLSDKIGICRTGGGQFAGVVMEAGTWAGITITPTQRGQLDLQQKTVYALP